MATAPTQFEERRNVTGGQLALVGLLILILLVVAWFVFLRPAGTEEKAAAPVPAETPQPEPTEEAKKPAKGPVETFEVFAPRDPFKPVISEAAAGGTAPAPGATPAPGETTTGTAIGGGGGRNESVGGHRVRLVDVFREGGREQARVQVDGTVYTVGEGERFAGNFELLSIEGRCASLLFGDDQFTLCEGEEILK